jgi:diadenosine tetraphosphate (Ap4A) HIT family hydrolase
MFNTGQRNEKVSWVFRWDNDTTLILAECGIWEAQLARDVYSKGQIFVCPKAQKENKVQNFLGGSKDITCQDKLIKLIADVSNAMVQVLHCEKVYLVSMNESEDKPLHFWLIPRYGANHKDESFIDHESFLNRPLKKYCGEKYDGLNLLSALRNKFIEAMCENKWGNMPPKPINCKKDWKRKWLEYAKDYESKFKKFLGKRIGGRVLRHSEGARVV